MKQWRILHSESSRGWGGQEVRVFAELEWMRAHGQWVALAAHPDSEIARRAQAAGMTLVPLRFHKALLPVEVLKMAAWLIANRVEVVNTHSSNDGWLAGLAARLTGRLLIRSRHIEVDYPNSFWSGLAFRTLPHHVITTSQRIADRLVAELGVAKERVSCIATGVDLTRFDPGAVKGTLRAELGLDADTALIGMISVLRSWKGHATLLDAAKQLISQRRKIHFAIAGEGTMRVVLPDQIAKAGLSDSVTLLGHRADVPNVLASLDVLVLPSYAHEGIPQIILQAQAMGCPVVATRIGGIPEVVEDGVTGLLVEPKDGAALARAIGPVLDDERLRAQLSQVGRARVVERYSLDCMGERLLKLYSAMKEVREGSPQRRLNWSLIVLLFAYFVAPATLASLQEKSRIDAVLSGAKSIRLEHYRTWQDMRQGPAVPDEIFSTRDLSPTEFSKVKWAFPWVPDVSFPGIETGCIFNPHHRVMITEANGHRATIRVCFDCDHVEVRDDVSGQAELVATPFVWRETLRRFFAGEGMPNSPDRYRRP